MTSNPIAAYQQVRVNTASQGQLILMLYDESLKQMHIAQEELSTEHPRLDVAHNAIVKAQSIITELSASLDFDKGGAIANNLFHLYMYFNQCLMNANVNKNSEQISEVSKLMADLRDAWSTVSEKAGNQTGTLNSGINIAGYVNSTSLLARYRVLT